MELITQNKPQDAHRTKPSIESCLDPDFICEFCKENRKIVRNSRKRWHDMFNKCNSDLQNEKLEVPDPVSFISVAYAIINVQSDFVYMNVWLVKVNRNQTQKI